MLEGRLDSGAVPDASTNIHHSGACLWGRNRIDRYWSLREVNANDNVAQPKFMKKRNSFARKVGFTKGMAVAA